MWLQEPSKEKRIARIWPVGRQLTDAWVQLYRSKPTSDLSKKMVADGAYPNQTFVEPQLSAEEESNPGGDWSQQ